MWSNLYITKNGKEKFLNVIDIFIAYYWLKSFKLFTRIQIICQIEVI